MADHQPLRIGLVGAGANTRDRHIPGFRAIPGVELVGVVNRSPESTVRVATEFGIPKAYADWRQLVEDPKIDAVCIGTWPNLHCEVTCAALAAGKHVLTEARMARNVAEARQMLAASQAHPHLVAQIVPSPFGLVPHTWLKSIIDGGFLGTLREVVVLGADDMFWDYSKLLHWRQDNEISGLNVLALGIIHETLCRFIPAPTRVFAQSSIHEPLRPHPEQTGQAPVTVPDNVQIVTHLPDGARGIYHISGSVLFGPGKQIHLYGSRGTIKYLMAPEEQIWTGRAGDSALRLIDLPAAERGGWRVEAEFVGAIRGQEKVQFTDFPTGVKYMAFTEAVAKSAATGVPVELA